MRTAYRCRAYPDEAQQRMLARTFGCIRVVWNRTLAERRRLYQAEGTSLCYAASDAALTKMKKDSALAFLNDVSSVPLQQTLRHQHAAFQAFFAQRARYPRFKSRRGRQSATYTRNAFSMRDGMLRLAKMATPLRMLEYKAQRYDRRVAVVDRWYPSSKTCSRCGYLLTGLSLGTRHWTCPSCGARHDRDVNAAQNILAAGLAAGTRDGADACGGTVRRAGAPRTRVPVKQEPRPVREGIPVL